MVHSTYNSKSDKETQDIGFKFAQGLKPGDCVFLYGDLGFGKTTFVKGIAKGLGITSRIISPTFVVVRTHNIQDPKSKIQDLIHIDLYRIEGEKQLIKLGLEEILLDKVSIKLIEWPERMAKLSRQRWDIVFDMNKDNTRTINLYEYK